LNALYPVLSKFVRRWSRLVIGVRLVLTAIFIPVMIFGTVVFPEARLVALLALVVLSIFLFRDIRARRGYAAGISSREMDGAGALAVSSQLSNGGSARELCSQLCTLWRVHVAVVVVQLIGVATAWTFLPLDGLISVCIGGAAASLPGFAVGLLWQHGYSESWERSAKVLRYAYTFCAVTMSIAGASLMVICHQFLN